MSDRFYIQGGQVFIGVIIYSDQLQWFLLDTPEGQNVWVLVVPWFGSVRFGSLISRTLDPTVVQVRPLGRTSDWTPPNGSKWSGSRSGPVRTVEPANLIINY